jgi:hypothetical protein
LVRGWRLPVEMDWLQVQVMPEPVKATERPVQQGLWDWRLQWGWQLQWVKRLPLLQQSQQ